MIVVYAALSLLGALTLAALVLTPGRWWWRAAAIVAVAALNGFVLLSVPNTDGLASSSAPEDGARLIACFVDEPTYVYFWLELDSLPVAYRTAYDPQTHAACDSAKRAVAAGVPVGLRAANAGDRRQGFRGRYVPYVLPPERALKQGGQP